MSKSKYIFIILMSLILLPMQAQEVRTSISGVVVDGDTGETLPFAQIYFLKSTTSQGMVPSEVGTTSDLDGNFTISNTAGYTTLNIQMIGYKTEMLTLRKGQNRTNVKVKLTPDVYGLQDIVVTPKHRKREYKRKGNPAVELIKNVIAHKDSFQVKTVDQYTAKSYSRMSFALDNIQVNWEKPFWRDFAFVEKYIDTTGVYPNVTVSIREHLNTEYYQRKPHREKKVLDKKRIFGIESVIGSDAFQENMNAIFKDVDINDNNMNLLFNRFVSPLSSTLAVTFYQYYIMDTIMVDGYPCIDLAFVPVNSESYGFTGHLYIVNDSTYRLKKYAINVPPDINLNFVSNFSIEHSYKQLENGLWAPDRTSTYAKFYILNNKKGMLARQTKIYTGWDLETPIARETFSSLTAANEVETNDTTAELVFEGYWTDSMRPEPLTPYESSVVDLVREFTNTPKFNSLALFANALTTGYIPTREAEFMYLSKFDFGPIFNFVSWNMLEGVRFRVGGGSTARLHDQVYFRGYVAYGIKDLRPKYSGTVVYTFGKHKNQPYDGIKHHLQLTAQYDVEEPGQITDVVRRDNILMSIPTSKPTMPFAQYVFHAKVEYMKEWRNNMIFSTYFDYTNNEAAGVLHYNRIDYTQHINGLDTTYTHSFTDIPSYRNYELMLDFEYSPGSTIGMDREGIKSPWVIEKDAPTIKLTHYLGYLDDRHNGGKGFLYNKTEVMFDKRFWFSAFGHLDLRIQTGMIWQQVPFTKLHIPPTSTSILLGQRAFNLMKPMEFMMDEYVSLYTTYYFKGWILNRIPGINKMKLRGVVSFAGIYGGLTKKNNPYLETNSGLYDFPHSEWENGIVDNAFDHNGYLRDGYSTSSPIGKLPYMEITAGFENIFKFIRIDYIRRLTYNDYELPYMIRKMEPVDPLNPTLGFQPAVDENGEPVMIHGRRRIGAWGRNGVKVTVRFEF
ncbi:MAG: carboxypeptidase-like regulatory domain-containing protein [Paludibacteraceae bacterium]|nr:carboxypeptidase-like regulatory domain-containing protein [Paludibacteraceae bacterium]